MKQPKWNDHDYEALIREYQDKTGTLLFQPLAIAKWAQQQKYSMPIPPTPVEMLARGIAGAATRAKARDRKYSFLYRVHLAVKMVIGGEKKTVYVDADGPAVTEDAVLQSARARREFALNILVSAQSSLDHFYAERPHLPRQTLDYNMSDEVQWRMNFGRDDDADEQKKSG